MRRTVTVAVTAVFVPLVTATTILFVVPIPASAGFFNLGEAAVYVSALLFGPVVGSLAGGVGSSLADIIVGYQFPFITLIAKGGEGLITGYTRRKVLRGWRTPFLADAISCLPGGLFMVMTYVTFSLAVFGYGGAIGELAFDIPQMVFGTLIAVPVVAAVRSRVPSLSLSAVTRRS